MDKLFLKFVKWLMAVVVVIGGGVLGFREWIVTEASAVADQKIQVVKEIRAVDMKHIDDRFDRVESLIRESR